MICPRHPQMELGAPLIRPHDEEPAIFKIHVPRLAPPSCLHHSWVTSLDFEFGTSSKNSSLIQNHWTLWVPRKTVCHWIKDTVRLVGTQKKGGGSSFFLNKEEAAFPRWWGKATWASVFKPQHCRKPSGWYFDDVFRAACFSLWASDDFNFSPVI